MMRRFAPVGAVVEVWPRSPHRNSIARRRRRAVVSIASFAAYNLPTGARSSAELPCSAPRVSRTPPLVMCCRPHSPGAVRCRVHGHTGRTGRALHDPDEKLTVVYLTNGLCRPIDNERRCAEMFELVQDLMFPRPASAWVTQGLLSVSSR